MRVQSEIMKKWQKKKVIEKLEWTDAEVQPVAVWPTKDGYTRQKRTSYVRNRTDFLGQDLHLHSLFPHRPQVLLGL